MEFCAYGRQDILMLNQKSNKYILGISNCFPRNKRINFGTFAYELYNEIARQGFRVKVIAPYSKMKAFIEKTKRYDEFTDDNRIEEIIRPSYLAIPTSIINSPWTYKYNLNEYKKTIKNVLIKMEDPEWVSSYFLFSGIAAIDAVKNNVPVYVEIGESNIKHYESYLRKREIVNYLSRFAGIIAVSKTNYELIEKYGIFGDRLVLLENCVNLNVFYKRDKNKSRMRYGISKDIFIVGFIGAFVERKGPLRVLEAINKLPDTYGIFIGNGKQKPKGKRVLMARCVKNNEVPYLLSCCDIFCLPSLAEGMSVALLEALACGLPVVVSDLPFNRSFLDEKNAIFVDPKNILEISDAINQLRKNDSLRYQMSNNNLEKAREHSLENRVKKLIEFVNRTK